MTLHQTTPHLLTDRAILTLSGPDRKQLLQGIITNDVTKIAENQAIYAALLTPQGKYLFDFFLSEFAEVLYLDCQAERLPDLMRRLMMYRLRAEVEITDCSAHYDVLVAAAAPEGVDRVYRDPRHPALGYRAIVKKDQARDIDTDRTAYDSLRLSLGIPDGTRDFDVDKTLILEGNMEALNGVSFTKGCYVGQEVTARMKHRTNLKKRLLPVTVTGPLPDRGTEILNDAGKKVGDLRSGLGAQAIGYFRLSDLDFNQTYHCGAAVIAPLKPDWLPEI